MICCNPKTEGNFQTVVLAKKPALKNLPSGFGCQSITLLRAKTKTVVDVLLQFLEARREEEEGVLLVSLFFEGN